ncbi:L-xylulose reductase-like protein [Dinothrombium tinctorium]|uniref:L-xylulose reductase-like protein n=1 Tax=Dinothrombium tinctorium TaxID=1965070 RepID=A0A3S3P9Q4_9ACAR|nr:L-xylulose reductase-like protein [Dinothrombium tinctorium]
MKIAFGQKTALVTGAGRDESNEGIGRELVKKLVECDAKVIAFSKTKENLDSLKLEVPQVQTFQVDVSDWNSTKALISQIGPIDLLVNNAGYACCQAVGEVTEEEFDKVFNINVKSIVNITQEIAKAMIKRGKGGSIVNISSQASMVALKDHLVYGASKAAVDQLTRTFALELGHYNIRVNSVNPTVVNTDMGKVGWSDPAKAKSMLDKIPLHRFAEPVEVVDTVLFLLSDKAAMISGVLLPIDGGFIAC